MKKGIVWVLVLSLLAGLCGCSAVSDIAGNVVNAAKQELEVQIKATLEKNKVNVIEVKSAFGKLNDNGGKYQFFCAALVKSDNAELLQSCADAIDKVCEITGVTPCTKQQIESPYLVHKSLSFNHGDFSGAGSYYMVYAYISDFSVDSLNITIPEITLPTFG